MNRKWIHGLLLFLGLVFLVLMLRAVGVEKVWHNLASLGWGLVPLVLIEGIGEVFHTRAWWRCLDRPVRSLPFARLFWMRLAGYSINYFTPTAALGGEVTRISLIAPIGRTAEATSAVLIDKACLALAHLLLVVVGAGCFLWRIQLPPALRTTLLLSGAVMAGGIISFMWIQQQGRLGVALRWPLLRRFAGARGQKVAGNAAAVDEAFRAFYRDRRTDLAFSLIWHMGGHAASLLQTWLFFKMLGQHPGFTVVAGVWVVGLWFDMLVFLVPMSLGTLEGSRVATFTMVGYGATEGLTFGMVLRLGQWFWAVLGLAGYAMMAFSPRTASASPTHSKPDLCRPLDG